MFGFCYLKISKFFVNIFYVDYHAFDRNGGIASMNLPQVAVDGLSMGLVVMHVSALLQDNKPFLPKVRHDLFLSNFLGDLERKKQIWLLRNTHCISSSLLLSHLWPIPMNTFHMHLYVS